MGATPSLTAYEYRGDTIDQRVCDTSTEYVPGATVNFHVALPDDENVNPSRYAAPRIFPFIHLPVVVNDPRVFESSTITC